MNVPTNKPRKHTALQSRRFTKELRRLNKEATTDDGVTGRHTPLSSNEQRSGGERTVELNDLKWRVRV